MRVGVMGAGSIGCYVGGRLLSHDDLEVVLIGRERLQKAVAEHGLTVTAFGGAQQKFPTQRVQVETSPDALADCDIVLCCVKSAQTEEVATQLANIIRPDAIVASLQNGVRNPGTLRAQLGDRKIIASIVDFNVVSKPNSVYSRTTSGALKFERCDTPHWRTFLTKLDTASFDVEEHDDILPVQWTKLLVNLNNAVSALSGQPTPQLMLSSGYRRAIAGVVEEGVRVLGSSGIRPAKFRGVPIAWMPKVLRLPTPVVRVIFRAQMKLDPEARSSMWEDLTRRRPTEIDFINQEIVRLAEENGTTAPVNTNLVGLIRKAEEANEGSPNMSAEALCQALGV